MATELGFKESAHAPRTAACWARGHCCGSTRRMWRWHPNRSGHWLADPEIHVHLGRRVLGTISLLSVIAALELTQAFRAVLLGAEVPVGQSRRAQSTLARVLDERSADVDHSSQVVASLGLNQVGWTFAGTKANAWIVAGLVSLGIEPRPDPVAVRGQGLTGESIRALSSVLESGLPVQALDPRVRGDVAAPDGQAAVGERIPTTGFNPTLRVVAIPAHGAKFRRLATRHRHEQNIGVNPVTTKPWQIVALATLCFIQAVHLLTEILGDLMVRANPASATAWAEMGFRASDSGPDVASVYDYLANSQYIFTVMAVVIFMFGFLLYRGEYLPAVRLTGTIFFAVGFMGQLFSPATADGTPLNSELADYLSTGLSALLLLGFLSLFAGKSAQWVKEHADS